MTIIRGHKHLHECAFIGDDSCEELEELLEIAEEQGLLNITALPENLKVTSIINYSLGNNFYFHIEMSIVL